MTFSRKADDNQELLFINRAKIADFDISVKDHDLKVVYKDKEYFLDFKKVKVEYDIGFEDQKGNQGRATYSQKGNMLIWGKVDLQEEDNAQFFNISMSKVDLQEDKEIKIIKKIDG